MKQLHHYALFHRSSLQNNMLENDSRSFCTSVNLYGFKWRIFVAACANDFGMLVAWNECLEDFCRHASECTQISSNVSSERTHYHLFSFLFNKEHVGWNLFLSHISCWFERNGNTRRLNSNVAMAPFIGSFRGYYNNQTMCITLHCIFMNENSDLCHNKKPLCYTVQQNTIYI
jgi:hypothetical protein